jgi:DNA-binding NtrC family response regulator
VPSAPPIEIEASAASALPADSVLCIPLGARLADVERQVILATFAHYGQQKERTAATLGISMRTLYIRLKEYQR